VVTSLVRLRPGLWRTVGEILAMIWAWLVECLLGSDDHEPSDS
jgi:hypothetical protein